ncbi:2-dehydropantoate 2-reductase [Shouchella sp. JSM 1781072]|uniref:2-dehydropantoate 2-reductase n=1 Tax=Shouchella sp. JSM 1781072 TaxID=3344581 RepID=UPI0035C0FCA8
MKIAVIGAGAVGLFIAATLRSEEVDVSLFMRSKQTAALIEADGVNVKRKDQDFNARDFLINRSLNETYDVIIVCVKSYQVKQVVEEYRRLDVKGTNWLFLQNGMEHLQTIEQLSEPVYVGIVEYGLLKDVDKPNLVSVKGEGRVKIAAFRNGFAGGTLDFTTLIAPNRLSFVWQNDYKDMLESKLIMNACINPLTALLNVKNGALIANPFYEQVMERCFLEVMLVLNRCDRDEKWREVKRICEQTKENQSSMLTDLRQERPLELDGIVGYLLKKGKERQLPIPLLSLLYELLQGKQAMYK